MWHYVYALMNKEHEIYIGYTHDLSHRIKQHNENAGAMATKNKGPWHIFSIEIFKSEKDARKREGEIIKSFEGGAFLEKTYWSRAAIQEALGLEHTDWSASIVNNRRNESIGSDDSSN